MRYCWYIETFVSLGKPEEKDPKPSEAKANAGVKHEKDQGKSKVKIVEPSKDAKKNAEDDDTEDDEDDDEDDDNESAEDEVKKKVTVF